MKKFTLLSVMLLALMTAAAQKTPREQLNEAIYNEEVIGDLEKALKTYDAIISNYPEERAVVAEVLYRMGLANEKLGNEKAISYYENVIQNYSDQSEQAKLARARLARLKASMMDPAAPEGTFSLQKIASIPYWQFDMGMVSNDARYYAHTNWGQADVYCRDLVTGERFDVSTAGKWSEGTNAFGSVWSPDDKKLVYAWSEGGWENPTFKLKMKDMESSRESVILERQDKFAANPLQWSDDGRSILVSYTEKDSTCYGMVDVGTGEVKKLKSVPRVNPRSAGYMTGLPALSPDAQNLLYCPVKEDGTRDVVVLHLEGGKEQIVADNPADDWGPVWAKDGKTILFASDRTGDPALYKVVLEDKKIGYPEIVYDGLSSSFRPYYVTPENQLVYETHSEYADIYLADVNLEQGTISEGEIFVKDAVDHNRPAWSNDGSKIAMIIRQGWEDYSDELMIKDVNTGEEKLIEIGWNVELMGGPLKWSPDDKMVMVEDQVGGLNLTLVDLESGEVKRIEKAGRPADFLSDNSIVVEDGGVLKRIDLLTMKTDTLLMGNPIGGFQVSPDRKKLAFTGTETIGANDYMLTSFWILDLKSMDRKKVLEAGENAVFSFRNWNWLGDNQHLMVVLVEIDEDYQEAGAQAYIVDIKTGEKKPLGPKGNRLADLPVQKLSPQGDRMVYLKRSDVKNIWSLIFH